MAPTTAFGPKSTTALGFTLVEILVVVTILGIMGAIVIPQFSNASTETRIVTVQADLKTIRSQLQVYAAQHKGEMPALATFVDQLTMASNADGTTAAVGTPGFPFGPYMEHIPRNPFTLTRTVTAGDVGTSGWYYDEGDGEFLANDSAESRAY